MADAGRVYLFGDGSNRINPIHGADLAEVCAAALESGEKQLDVGGPEEFTYREIAELAFEVIEKPRKITCVPKTLIAAVVGALRWLTPVRTYGPIQFLASVMTMDIVGEAYGQRKLVDHFRRCSAAVADKTADFSRRAPGLKKHHPRP